MAEVVLGTDFYEETQTEIDYRVREGGRGIDVFDRHFSDDAQDIIDLLSGFVPASAESTLFASGKSRIQMTVTSVMYFERTGFIRMTINYRAFGDRSFQFDVEEMLARTNAELILITYAEQVMSLRVGVPIGT